MFRPFDREPSAPPSARSTAGVPRNRAGHATRAIPPVPQSIAGASTSAASPAPSAGPARRLAPITARAPALVRAALACLCAALAACSSTHVPRDWSGYSGPGAEHFQKEELEFPHVDDPLEPANRVLSIGNFVVLRYVVAPLAGVYRNFVPGAVRARLEKAGVHFQWPIRVVNTLLQGEWGEAGEETARFAVNSTAGVLGLFDPAADLGLRPHAEDFGQTLAHWGWEDSVFLFLPVVGPSTVRDGLGLIPDLYLDPASLDWRIGAARRFNAASNDVEALIRTVDASYDAYEPARTLAVLNRRIDVEDFEWKSDESGSTQSLDSIFLAPQDARFPELARTGRVELAADRALPYSLWLQPEPAPLVYLVPGMGGHRLGNASLALAEIVYASGSSVVTLSNPTNWEFIAHGSTVELPGYVPEDARDLHRAITAIDRELEARLPGRLTTRRLAGISMGAFQTLFIAAREREAEQEGLLLFELYVALDPPANLEHGIGELDRFYNAPLAFPAAERERRIEEIFGKVLYLAQGDLEPDLDLPFTRIEAEFLIGLAFRMDLQFTILQTQSRRDRGVLRVPRSYLRRAPAFREAAEYSFVEYMYAFVLPYYAERDPRITFDEAGARTLFGDCDVRAIAAGLEANERVLVFANENDFLLRPEDKAWLREHLGERVHLFPAGGHLGNLHRKAIQEAIRGLVAETLDETEAPE